MDDKILVENCPLCRIFTHKEIKTKLYWPESIDKIPNAEFVIVNCESCKFPLIVLGEHTTGVSKECWGRILYRCRSLFGGNMRLRLKMFSCTDHWHAHLEKKEF